ncbi:MAG: hypothetical protein M3220_22465, partial [Chloroflexota bacterium]|nr:hypothetical protein [Chloroflexota bacterium]
GMGLLAFLSCVIALSFGFLMTWCGWSHDFMTKLRLVFGVVLVQTILTAIAPFIRSESVFLAWIVIASGTLGIRMLATFSLTVDLIPMRDRGNVAALITAIAYLAAPVLSGDWVIELFAIPFSGFGATFLSTALAIQWRVGGMPVERHLSIVDALAMLFFVGMLGVAFLGIGRSAATGRGLQERRSS